MREPKSPSSVDAGKVAVELFFILLGLIFLGLAILGIVLIGGAIKFFENGRSGPSEGGFR